MQNEGYWKRKLSMEDGKGVINMVYWSMWYLRFILRVEWKRIGRARPLEWRDGGEGLGSSGEDIA